MKFKTEPSQYYDNSKAPKYCINSKTVAQLAYNEIRLDSEISKAIKHDGELNDEFNLLKMH